MNAKRLDRLLRVRRMRVDAALQALVRERAEVERCERVHRAEVDRLDALYAARREKQAARNPGAVTSGAALACHERYIARLDADAEQQMQRVAAAEETLTDARYEREAALRRYQRTEAKLNACELQRTRLLKSETRVRLAREEDAADDNDASRRAAGI